MKIVSIVGIVSAVLLGALAFLATNNYIVAAVVLVLALGYYMLIAHKMIKKYLSRVQRTHECYKFINSFLITMSVKESLTEAFSSGTLNASPEFKKELADLENMVVEDRIIYLRRYFDLAIYKMFINVLKLYQDQGGNILALGETLMQETTMVENSVTRSFNIGVKKIVEYAILWVLTFAILIFMRFGMSDFYITMLNNRFFVFCLIVFFLFFIAAFHIFLLKFTKLSIKEDKVNEED